MDINVKRKGDKLHVHVSCKPRAFAGGHNRTVWRTPRVLSYLKEHYSQYKIGATLSTAYVSNFEPEKRSGEWVFQLIPRTIKSTKPAGTRPSPPNTADTKKPRRPIPVHKKTLKGNK
jgi:hypothetical protein